MPMTENAALKVSFETTDGLTVDVVIVVSDQLGAANIVAQEIVEVLDNYVAEQNPNVIDEDTSDDIDPFFDGDDLLTLCDLCGEFHL